MTATGCQDSIRRALSAATKVIRVVSELVVVVFRDQYRAPEVLNELRRRNYCWLNEIDETVAVTLDELGKAKVQLSLDVSNYKGTGWVRIWLSLLSSVLFSPVPEVMVGAVKGNVVTLNGRNGSPAAMRESSEAKWW